MNINLWQNISDNIYKLLTYWAGLIYRPITFICRNSSVGRALDWRSKGPWFNPGFRHVLFALCFICFLMFMVNIHDCTMLYIPMQNQKVKVRASFELTTFCVLGRCDNHYTTGPLGLWFSIYKSDQFIFYFEHAANCDACYHSLSLSPSLSTSIYSCCSLHFLRDSFPFRRPTILEWTPTNTWKYILTTI